MTDSTRTLDLDDPRVQAARRAERDVYRHYGLEPEEHFVEIPDLDLQIRVVETGKVGAEHFPDVEFHEVGVGHLPWLDEPETCGDLVRDLLDRRG